MRLPYCSVHACNINATVVSMVRRVSAGTLNKTDTNLTLIVIFIRLKLNGTAIYPQSFMCVNNNTKPLCDRSGQIQTELVSQPS